MKAIVDMGRPLTLMPDRRLLGRRSPLAQCGAMGGRPSQLICINARFGNSAGLQPPGHYVSGMGVR